MRLETSDEATFLFPPSSYPDVASYANFWATVPISDGVLSNISAGYSELIRKQKIAEGTAWAQKYDNAHDLELKHGSDNSKDAARYQRTKAFEEYMAKWHRTHPERIRAASARSVARAGQAYYYSSALDEAGQNEISSSTVIVGDQEMTIETVVEIFQLRLIRDYFQDPDVTTAERLEDLRVELRNMQQG